MVYFHYAGSVGCHADMPGVTVSCCCTEVAFLPGQGILKRGAMHCLTGRLCLRRVLSVILGSGNALEMPVVVNTCVREAAIRRSHAPGYSAGNSAECTARMYRLRNTQHDLCYDCGSHTEHRCTDSRTDSSVEGFSERCIRNTEKVGHSLMSAVCHRSGLLSLRFDLRATFCLHPIFAPIFAYE